jgi:hypothetical protein
VNKGAGSTLKNEAGEVGRQRASMRAIGWCAIQMRPLDDQSNMPAISSHQKKILPTKKHNSETCHY